MDLSDPTAYARIYDEHARGVYGAAYRVLGNAAQAQDVTQDVFVKVWRQPQKFDARRGELGSYLRLMARSRALDLWREAQAAGARRPPQARRSRATRRRTEDRPRAMAERERAPRGARRARPSCPPPSARRSCWRTGAA